MPCAREHPARAWQFRPFGPEDTAAEGPWFIIDSAQTRRLADIAGDHDDSVKVLLTAALLFRMDFLTRYAASGGGEAGGPPPELRHRAEHTRETVPGRRRMMSTASLVLAVGTGVVVIVVAVAVVLVVLIVAVSMRGFQKRGAERRGEARGDRDGAREREGRQRDRDTAREGREDNGPDR
jgi:hypothetical protein